MKKSAQKQKRPSKHKAGTKPPGKTRGSHGEELSQTAQTLVSGAKKLYGPAHKFDLQVDALHGSIHELHTKAKVEPMHPERLAAAADTEDIVKDETPEGNDKPFPIVGIGASAGGYEAFAELLHHLPKDTGMAFVLVQHLDPKHKSNLRELLSHSSKIPVLQAADQIEVRPDQIYVIPENSNMTLADGKLRVHPRKAHESPPMPIDLFLRSLANQQQTRAIGVVLSGTGCDGTLGVEAIKGEGGITFAQDDRTSKYYGMPRSAAASGAVDFVLSPAEIAQELGRIAKHPMVGPHLARRIPPISSEAAELQRLLRERPDELTTLFRLLRARTGLDFSQYKQSTLKRRIMRRMILHKKEELGQYIRLAEGSPAELDALFDDLLINVTSFFRDPQTFNMLKKKVFPRILKTHIGETPLRFWVCGCSTGEEPYSLAMALVEFLDENRLQRQVQIFATDVSDAGIEKGRAGVYPLNIQQDVSPERLRRFFTKVNGNFQVRKSIRNICVFARQNVLVDPPFSNLDLVSCRNVLNYFGPPLQRRVVPLFHYSLRTGGFLLLGTPETIGAGTEHFSLVDKKNKIYIKKTSLLPPGFELRAKPPEPEHKEIPPGTGNASTHENKPTDLQHYIDRLLLREFAPATVVVNSDMDVVYFRGRTGLYLEHAPGTASFNLFKMLREKLAITVRAALREASLQDLPVKHSGIEFRHNGHWLEVAIEVVPFRLETLDDRFFAIVFHEHPAPVPFSPARGSKGKQPPDSGPARLRRELTRVQVELAETKESMQSVIEEQEATNEELKSANEEIQSSNEELQSTNEELETAKEELQSTNEELTTLNEELQIRNTELSQVNNDLLNLLASVSIPIVMVDNGLRLRRFTPVAEGLFNLIPSDVGRPLSDIGRSTVIPELDKSIRQVLDELSPIERETQDRDGNWFLLRIRPYRTRENNIDGAVIVLIDIDELRQALEVVLGLVHQPLLILGLDFKVRSANTSFLDTFALRKEDALGRLIYDLNDSRWNIPQLHSLLEEALPRNRQVSGVELEANFGKAGFRKLRLNASRFAEEGEGVPLILLAIEEREN